MPPKSKTPTSGQKQTPEKKSNSNDKKEIAAPTETNNIKTNNSSRVDYYCETPGRTRSQLTLWSFILITSVVILFILEKSFVLDPILNEVTTNKKSKSPTSHHHDLSDLKSLRSSIHLGEGGLVLVDAREEVEIVSDGYHPSSILIPYSRLCKFIAKNFQHLPASKGFHTLVLNLMSSQSSNDQWKLKVFFDFISNVVIQEFNYFFRNQQGPAKFSFIKTIFDFLFLTQDQFKSNGNPLINKEEIIRELEFHHPNKTKLFSASPDAEDIATWEFYKNSVSSLDKVKRAKTVLVISSESGWRSQVAAHYLNHLLFADEAVDVFSLKENFVELLPTHFHDKTFRKFGFVRDDLKPMKSLSDSSSSTRKGKGWATPEIEAILETERKNKKK